MTEDLYVVAIAALLPLTACMVVFQVNPYHALVIRGILGAVAALVYALFGAADVALTEALVGTMLSITLYAVAVRSSLNLRLGVLEREATGLAETPEHKRSFESLQSALRELLDIYHMQLELVTYPNVQALQMALTQKDIHATCVLSERGLAEHLSSSASVNELPTYHIHTRVQRLYTLMHAKLPSALASLTYAKSAGDRIDANEEGSDTYISAS
ncbi:MAG: DUF4040 domain-containing protein [Elainellaceae cyanobacterium]